MMRQQRKPAQRGPGSIRRSGKVIRMPVVRARRRRQRLTYVATGVVILVGLSIAFRFHRAWLPSPFVPPPRPSPGDLSELGIGNGQLKAEEANLLAAVNQARHEVGAGPLQLSTGLEQVAREHSYDMSVSYRFAHEGSDGSGPPQRLQAAGVTYSLMGENIYQEQNGDPGELANRIVQGWLHSPPHRKNLLSPDFTRTGIGIAHGGGITYVTEDFIRE
jgi:uncharacterized protein YkwD